MTYVSLIWPVGPSTINRNKQEEALNGVNFNQTGDKWITPSSTLPCEHPSLSNQANTLLQHYPLSVPLCQGDNSVGPVKEDKGEERVLTGLIPASQT